MTGPVSVRLDGTGAVVGPNAALHLAAALRAEGREEIVQAVFRDAGCAHWLTDPPGGMIPEAAAAALFAALQARLPADQARSFAVAAGRRTGAYILAHRIPRPVRLLMRLLPARLAGRLLGRAILRHAWTFAGSGRCSLHSGGTFGRIEIAANPLRMPGAPWHAAVLSVLFAALVHPRARAVPSCVGANTCSGCSGPCRLEIVTV